MMSKSVLLLLWLLGFTTCDDFDEQHAKQWLEEYSKEACEFQRKIAEVSWNYHIDMRPVNQQHQLTATMEQFRWLEDVMKNASKFNWKTFEDYDVKRQLQGLAGEGDGEITEFIEEDELVKYATLAQVMQIKFSTAQICDYHNQSVCNLRLEPEITRIMADSRDYEELKWVWKQWRDQTGKQMRDAFVQTIDMLLETLEEKGIKDMSKHFTDIMYETEDLEEQLESLWEELRPFYLQLHAYARTALQKTYGKEKVTDDGPMPAHIFGDMWAQSWTNIGDILRPYPQKQSIDVAPQMKRQGYTAEKMFRMADAFFVSLGFPAVPKNFWRNSVLRRIEGKMMACHGKAWDFCETDNVRISMCTDITMEDFVTAHHEMGHIIYYQQYANQKFLYKRGANPGFHEAIGDTVALSVLTPKHLYKVGLLDTLENDTESDINFLMDIALDKIAFLPFSYLIDLYRWKVYDGEITTSDLNCKWWELREKFQGVSAPVPRNENDFDAGAKKHIATSVMYIRYFVAVILQFDFHRSLCIEAGEYVPDDPEKPLYKCDIYQSKTAGTLLSSVLKMGGSRPWPDALEKITGRRKMSADAIKEYFKPLEEWLKKKNKENGATIGWKEDGSYCSSGVRRSDSWSPLILLYSLVLALSHNRYENLY